jgi:hypothetical protein
METKKSVKTHGSMPLIKALEIIKQFQPTNFCQFKFLLEGVVLFVNPLPKLKLLQQGGTRSIRKKPRRKTQKTKGGNNNNSDKQIITHFVDLYSTLGSFDNIFGSCVLNTMAVVKGVNSKEFQKIYYAFASTIENNDTKGIPDDQAAALVTNKKIITTADWIRFSTVPNISPVEFVLVLKNKLEEIRQYQRKTSLLTSLGFKFKNDNVGHAIAVWYTEQKQVVLIDIQTGWKQHKFEMFCEHGFQLPDEMQNKHIFKLSPIDEYINNNIAMGLDKEICLLKTSIVQVDKFNSDSNSTPPLGSNFENILKKNFNIKTSKYNNAVLTQKLGKLTGTKIVNYFLTNLSHEYDNEKNILKFLTDFFKKEKQILKENKRNGKIKLATTKNVFNQNKFNKAEDIFNRLEESLEKYSEFLKTSRKENLHTRNLRDRIYRLVDELYSDYENEQFDDDDIEIIEPDVNRHSSSSQNSIIDTEQTETRPETAENIKDYVIKLFATKDLIETLEEDVTHIKQDLENEAANSPTKISFFNLNSNSPSSTAQQQVNHIVKTLTRIKRERDRNKPKKEIIIIDDDDDE